MKVRVVAEKYIQDYDGVLELTTTIIPENGLEEKFLRENREEIEYLLKPVELADLEEWEIWWDDKENGLALWEKWRVHPELSREKVKSRVDTMISSVKKIIADVYRNSLSFTIEKESPIEFPPEGGD